MIDFRYHVVSIIAVFLALSVGLVLGSSFLADIVKEDLDGRIQEQTRAAEAARRDLRAEEGENRALNNFIDGSKPELVAGKLKDKSVVLVTLPDAGSAVTDATVKTLEQSGATVTGTVAVKEAWVDAAKEPALTAAAGGTSFGQSGYDRAASVLAAAIVHKADARPSTPPSSPPATTPGAPASPGASTPAVPPQGQDPAADPAATPAAGPAPNPAPSPPAADAPTAPAPTGGTATATPNPSSTGKGETSPGETDTAAAVLNRFEDAGFIDVKGNPEKGATLAVVIAPSGPVDTADPARANGIYLGLSRALDTADDGTVVAGDTASVQNGGMVAALRADERTAKVVSSVDAAETTQGQVAVDWALVVESVDGKSGQYGATGQQGWLPPLPADRTDKTDKTDKTSGADNTETEKTS